MNIARSDAHDDRIIKTLKTHLTGSQEIIKVTNLNPNVYFDAPEIDLDEYDVFLVFMSSGKDSLAALKYLLDRGVPKSKIELHHHLVDGNEGSTLMDWAFMEDFTVKLAKALDIPLYMSWLKGGFEGEMLKENSVSQNDMIEMPEGLMELPRASYSKPSTRRKFPQQAASLKTRWCSSALKISLGSRIITSQPRFVGQKVLYVSGERREESSNRAKYNQFEPHSTDTMRKSGRPKTPRWVDVWRPVLHLSEEQIWEMLEDWRIIAPVPYRLGWSRSSCQTCIFNSDTIFATIHHYFPEKLTPIAAYEDEFGLSIHRNGKNVIERAKSAKPIQIKDEEALKQAVDPEYKLPIFLGDNEKWKLPAGAFAKESSGAS